MRGRPKFLRGEVTRLRVWVGEPERRALGRVRVPGETVSDAIRRLIHEADTGTTTSIGGSDVR